MSRTGVSSAQNNVPSRIVYLGSIPYDQTEEQILDLCSNVGPVVNLRMMFDQETGKSRGYAFVEYKDLESSASAVRNLNGYQLGSRLLKCGYASNSDMSTSNSNSVQQNADDGGFSLKFPELPSGVDVNINMTTPAMMISSELSKYSSAEQLRMLSLFQDWSKQNPEDAVDLFSECPQLSFVVAELLLTNGISKVDDLTSLAVTKQEDSYGSETRKVVDPNLRERQRELLKQVLQLNDSEISILPEDERMQVWDLKQKAMKGEFGMI